MSIHVRPARPEDAPAIAPLVFSSGPKPFDYVFTRPPRGDALSFLETQLAQEDGEFGYGCHAVVEVDGDVVGAGAAWSGGQNLAWTVLAARQIMARYGLGSPAVMVSGLRVERVVRPPTRSMQYIGHLGVEPTAQSQGVGSAMIEYFLEQGRALGKATAELDVAVTNPNAQRLYERLGFEVRQEVISKLRRGDIEVPSYYRMVLDL